MPAVRSTRAKCMMFSASRPSDSGGILNKAI
jgi:hypothetical protein